MSDSSIAASLLAVFVALTSCQGVPTQDVHRECGIEVRMEPTLTDMLGDGEPADFGHARHTVLRSGRVIWERHAHVDTPLLIFDGRIHWVDYARKEPLWVTGARLHVEPIDPTDRASAWSVPLSTPWQDSLRNYIHYRQRLTLARGRSPRTIVVTVEYSLSSERLVVDLDRRTVKHVP